MEINIQGMEALLKIIKDYPLEEAEENRALNAAAKVIQEAVIEEAPEDDRTLKDNIKVKRSRNGEAKVHTGGAYHAHIIEGGRSAGSKYALKNGKRQLVTWGAMRANPFFTRAFDKSKDQALDAMIDEIKKVKKL